MSSVITIDSQVHGYRHGHELLSSTLVLDRTDQLVLDRLSDVAGPLRSGENFVSYVSAYPLPSGRWFVLARTWPDEAARRPGCVLTLSLLISSDHWAHAESLMDFWALLQLRSPPASAVKCVVDSGKASSITVPAVPKFAGGELVEAVFLEEAKPIAVFDAPEPDIIALRLLTALWPSMRRRFALSTFALSPRRIEGRDFDLVFAPRNARQKFAEWVGRCLDGAASAPLRHRWTESIVQRVFLDPVPHLLDETEFQSNADEDNGTGALLRISLLWDELMRKMHETPTAALGLLDIARTRSALSAPAQRALRAALLDAVRRVQSELPAGEAWMLLGAMTRKLRGTAFSEEMPSIKAAAASLAQRDPRGALNLLGSQDRTGALADLGSSMAEGLAVSEDGALALLTSHDLQPAMAVGLLRQSEALSRRLAQAPGLQELAVNFANELTADDFVEFRDAILPHIATEYQLPLAARIIPTLEVRPLLELTEGLLQQQPSGIRHFIGLIVEHARRMDCLPALRAILLATRDHSERRELIARTLEPSASDISWLLQNDKIPRTDLQELLQLLLEHSDDSAFFAVMSHEPTRRLALSSLPNTATEVQRRVLLAGLLPLNEHVELIRQLLGLCSLQEQRELALQSLARMLPRHFEGDEVAAIVRLLDVVADSVSPIWMISTALNADLQGSLINRNLIAFDAAGESARSRLVASVDAISTAFEPRWALDIQPDGAHACANLFWSAARENVPGLLSASAKLTRVLFKSKGWPVSPIMPAVFPIVYRQLAAEDDVPDMLKVIPFFDWDKCKPARRELVDAFVHAQVWRPVDFAMTICQCPHMDLFIERAQRAFRGHDFLNAMAQSLDALPRGCQELVQSMLRGTGR